MFTQVLKASILGQEVQYAANSQVCNKASWSLLTRKFFIKSLSSRFKSSVGQKKLKANRVDFFHFQQQQKKIDDIIFLNFHLLSVGPG